MATCELCAEQVPASDVVDRLRVMHPEAYEPVRTWPGGEPVIEDRTLRPGDFTATDDGQPPVTLGKHQHEGAAVDDDDDLQDRGEELRQRYGIDGTMGDAQDVDHPFHRAEIGDWCALCGLAESHRKHGVAR